MYGRPTYTPTSGITGADVCVVRLHTKVKAQTQPKHITVNVMGGVG